MTLFGPSSLISNGVLATGIVNSTTKGQTTANHFTSEGRRTDDPISRSDGPREIADVDTSQQ